MRTPPGVRGLLLLTVFSAASGCTLVKPVVGAVTAPFVIIGDSGGVLSSGCHDGRGLAVGFAVMSCFGAVGGLVTGVISDVQVLNGAAEWCPTDNWWHPFRTNTSKRD